MSDSGAVQQQGIFEREVCGMLPDLYRFARALTSNAADAEDLVHDACVKALSACASADLPDRRACKAWTRRILVNTFRDQYRREQRAPVQTASAQGACDGDNIIELAASPDPSPEQWAQFASFESAAREAMTELPPEVRVVTTLHVVNGLPYKEIAEIAGCPIGTVMSRLARGRRLLRVALERFVDGGAGEDVRLARQE